MELARHICNDDLEIDAGADLSEGNENGCWIQAWCWLDFSGTELDKEKTDGEETVHDGTDEAC